MTGWGERRKMGKRGLFGGKEGREEGQWFRERRETNREKWEMYVREEGDDM